MECLGKIEVTRILYLFSFSLFESHGNFPLSRFPTFRFKKLIESSERKREITRELLVGCCKKTSSFFPLCTLAELCAEEFTRLCIWDLCGFETTGLFVTLHPLIGISVYHRKATLLKLGQCLLLPLFHNKFMITCCHQNQFSTMNDS